MAFMEWDDKLSVGIPSIDAQHKNLIALINKLNETMRQGKGSLIIGEVIDELVAYTQTHFRTEEELFALHSYPKAGAHEAEHRDFVAKVGEFRTRFVAKRIGVSVDVLDFLVDWLKGHIMKSDKEYSPFLVGKGVK